jgi:hypothetical protein
MKNTAALFDASAVALSTLCLLHCLALPLLAALLPLFGAWSEAEWVHGVFVLIAAPLSGYALWRGDQHGVPGERAETPLTVAGSLALAGAHLWNAARRHAH